MSDREYSGNGWSEYRRLVMRRLDDLEEQARRASEARERDRREAKERHVCLTRMMGELRDDVVRLKANRTLQWLKVAGVAFVVSYAVVRGHDLWDLLRAAL